MIERCLSYRRIKRFLPIDEIIVSRKIYYLIDRQDGVDRGLWYFHEWRDGALGHVSMGADCRGRDARDSGIAALRWMFENTEFTTIYAMSPNNIREAQIMAVWMGMTFTHADDDHRFYLIRGEKWAES